jgi:hypothetical protein
VMRKLKATNPPVNSVVASGKIYIDPELKSRPVSDWCEWLSTSHTLSAISWRTLQTRIERSRMMAGDKPGNG